MFIGKIIFKHLTLNNNTRETIEIPEYNDISRDEMQVQNEDDNQWRRQGNVKRGRTNIFI